MSDTETQRTFVMIKPDGMIIPRVQQELLITYSYAGLEIVAARRLQLSREQLTEQYSEHVEKPWFSRYIDSIRGEGEEFDRYVKDVLIEKFGPLRKYRGNLAMILEGKDNAIELVRNINGPTDPDEARKTAKNSIRAKFGGRDGDLIYNVVHASANPSDAERESHLYFPNLE